MQPITTEKMHSSEAEYSSPKKTPSDFRVAYMDATADYFSSVPTTHVKSELAMTSRNPASAKLESNMAHFKQNRVNNVYSNGGDFFWTSEGGGLLTR